MSIEVIDVSYHNGIIDFDKVKKSGISGVIIRAGYGKSAVDKQFIDNVKGAIKAGLHIGCYWFMYCKNNNEAIENAKKCVETIQDYKAYIDLGIYSDWEYDSEKRAPGQTKESRTEFVRLFNEYVSEKGFAAGTYTNIDYYKSKFDMSKLEKWPIWMARYYKELGNYDCIMWQYSSTGKVDGISGNVDLNHYYGPVSENKFENYEDKSEEYKMPTIKRGSKGKAVKIWQIIIGVESDGIFGPNTENQTKIFQKENELASDGIVGPKTWKAGLKSI